MKIKVIIPIENDTFNKAAGREIELVKAPDTVIEIENIQTGPSSIEDRFSDQLAHQEIIRLGKRAENSGADGIFVWCFTEPAVDILREIVHIPVVGAFMPAVLTANAVSQRYSIVTALPNVVPIYIKLSRELGVSSNIVSIREVGIPVLDMDDKALLLKNLVEQSVLAVKEGAQAIILGCTGMLDVAEKLQEKLIELEKPAVVVEPTAAAVAMLQGLIRQKVSQSRLAYMPAENYA